MFNPQPLSVFSLLCIVHLFVCEPANAHDCAPRPTPLLLLDQARVVPAFKDGKRAGWHLFSIRPDSVWRRLGVQDGDVVRLRPEEAAGKTAPVRHTNEPAADNGTPAGTAGSASTGAMDELTAIAEAASESRLSALEVERKGKPVQLEPTCPSVRP